MSNNGAKVFLLKIFLDRPSVKSKGYLIFHLNLAFSSVEEESRGSVIQDCYHPLLNLMRNENPNWY